MEKRKFEKRLLSYKRCAHAFKCRAAIRLNNLTAGILKADDETIDALICEMTMRANANECVRTIKKVLLLLDK